MSRNDKSIIKNKLDKKCLVWIHSHFYYWMGGTKFVHQVLSEIKKSNSVDKIVVIIENGEKEVIKKFEQSGITIRSLNTLSSNNILYWALLPIFLILNTIKTKKIIKNIKRTSCSPAIISGMFPMNVVASFLGVRHVQNCFEPFAFFYDKDFIASFPKLSKVMMRLLSVTYGWLDKWATRSADDVLTLNNTTQYQIKLVYGISSKKTQAGVDSILFKKKISRKIKNKYKKFKVAIHSTDYSPVKGTDRVIKAFALASKKVKNSKLLITTTIDDAKRRKQYQILAKKLGVEESVEFLGFVPIEDLVQYYSLARVMIQGAVSEKSGTTSMSLPVKEAMCCETPAIRPNIGGQDVVNGKTGFLIDPRNTWQMAKMIQKLLEDKKLSERMGKLARRSIVKNYTWKNTAQVFINSLQYD